MVQNDIKMIKCPNLSKKTLYNDDLLCFSLDDEETLHTFEVLLGIQLVNDFEINPFQSHEQDYGYEKKQGPSIRGLFALASMPSHNCIANSTPEFSSR